MPIKIKNSKSKIYFQEFIWAILVIVLSMALSDVQSSIKPNGSIAGISPEIVSGETVHSQKKQKPGSKPNSPTSASAADNLLDSSHVDKSPAYISKVKVGQKDNAIYKNGKVYPLRTYEAQLNPNDTFAGQWWESAAGMQAAWEIPSGSRQTTVAIIDSGFALSHQEFSGRWAYNTEESGATSVEGVSRLNCTDRAAALNESCNNIDDNFDGIVDNESGLTIYEHASTLNCTDQAKPLNKSCNRIDDDGNGLADDYLGWDFVNFERSAAAGETNPDGDGTRHGTMVAGVLGATGNNTTGIAGVNWHTKILPLQALDDDEYGNSYTVASAVYYAIERNVDLISISLGTEFEDPYLREAILAAQEAGILIVAASGNDGCDCIVYPANYPEVVAVGASNSSGNVASFSSFGENLDIVAPGSGMATSSWNKSNKISAYAGSVSGTSFATPFASGALALLRSYQPDASWDELVGTLFENSDRRQLSSASPRNNTHGYGFILVNRALNRSVNLFTPPIAYHFTGDILGSDHIRQCEGSLIPGSHLYELTNNGQIKYTINRYEIRKAENSGWNSRQLFGVCVGLPGDMPALLRSINLDQELRGYLIK